MDFELSPTQLAIREGVHALLARHAGAARAREIEAAGYDPELEQALIEAGYLDMFGDDDAGPLASTLLVEDVAAALGSAAIGAMALVGPALGLGTSSFAIARGGAVSPVRFGASVERLLRIGEHDVAVHSIAAAEPIESYWGYGFARVEPGECLETLSGSATAATSWWKLATLAELLGAVGAAFDLTLAHVTSRIQFGRPIGAFQAIQHRLAQLKVRIEGARWLIYRAAWEGASREAVLVAVAYAVPMGRLAVREAHQMNGAMGLTDEYDLRLWTTRAAALLAELGSVTDVQVEIATSRWSA